MRSLSAGIVCVLVLCSARASRAQDSAVADALFDKGLAEMTAGQFDAGCPKLAESQRLDPRPGTLFTLAECEAQWGKLATALARYEDYLRVFNRMSAKDQAAQRGRDGVAKEAIERLGPDVPTLTLRLPAGAPKKVVVLRNGTRLGGAALGVPLPVDPGEQAIVVELPDGRRAEQRVTVEKAEKKELELALPVAAPHSGSEPTRPAVESRAAEPAEPRSNTMAYVVGGIGVAGLAVGSVTGLLVFSKKGTIEDHCRGKECDQEGLDAADSAKSLGLISTIGFGVGIAGVATATVLLLSGPSEKDAPSDHARSLRPTVGVIPGGGFASLRGRF